MAKRTSTNNGLQENVIEWFNGDDYISCTLRSRKHINKVRKIAVEWPNLVPIFNENKDGSVFVRLPLKALKLSIISRKERGFED